MKKKLIIHFGIHRTGTTALQNILKKNRTKLLENGILYPDLGYECNHSRIAWGLVKNKVGTHSIEPSWLVEKIKSEEKKSTNTIILSHEDFCLVEDTDWIKLLKSTYDVTVVLYLRRQDLWLESWYNQHIKWPWSKKFSSCKPEFFLENYKDFFWIDYDTLLKKISSVVDKENIHVNTLDDSGVKDTTKDFLDYIGVSNLNEKTNSNASLSTAKIDILRRIDLMSLRGKNMAKNKIINKLNKLDIEEDNGSKIVFNDEQVNFILETFKDSNANVAKEYFGREELFSGEVLLNRKPQFVPDHKAYRVYIPKLLKELACQ